MASPESMFHNVIEFIIFTQRLILVYYRLPSVMTTSKL